VSPPPAADPVAIGERLAMASRVLGEERELFVYLPESYESGRGRFPVLYVLDGESDFVHTVGVVEFLAGIDRIPELIVVGVVNTARSRDLTPPSSNEEETAFWPEVGGADRFRRFFAEELVPFVDDRYRTQPYRVVRGQSFGGLFAVHDYMADEPVFHAVIASSPAVGWNRDTLVRRVPTVFEASPAPTRPLYVASAGKDFPGNLASIVAFAGAVDAAGLNPDVWRHDRFEDAGHYTLHHLSTYRGLEFVYSGWPVPDAVAATADFDAYRRHFDALSERYGYEISVPMRSITRMGNQLLRESKFDQGIRVFEQATGLYPDLPEARWRLGEAHRLAGHRARARKHLRIAYDMAVAQRLPDVADYRASLDRIEAR